MKNHQMEVKITSNSKSIQKNTRGEQILTTSINRV